MSALYDLGIYEIANLIAHGGHETTVLVEGDMGCGKTSILHTLMDMAAPNGKKLFPNHQPVYFDATTKDLGDLMIPNFKEAENGSDYVSFATNEELGFHIDGPIILMIDEIGKANMAVKQGLTRVLLERTMGGKTLHPDSLVFATTNLGEEGVGDLFVAHQLNRITRVRMRKPTNVEWIEWGINNNIDATLLGFAKENPALFRSFTEVGNPADNPYIYHPREQRTAFVTPRSLEKASKWISRRGDIGEAALTAALIGTIGERAAMDLVTYIQIADDLPTHEEIVANPGKAKIPESGAAVCMVVFRALANVDANCTWITQWVDYMERLDKEAQGMFANGVRASRYQHQGVVMNNKRFADWALDNTHMFAADKK